MPLNPITGIDYDNDRFAVLRLSDNVIINHNASWPRSDGGPIVGGNPDLRYYKRTAAPALDADHRFTVVNEWTPEDAVPTPPEGHPRGVYRQTLTAVKLPKEDLKLQVETHFQNLIQSWFPAASDPAVLIEALGASIRKGRNASLNNKQLAVLAKIEAIEDAITLNRERRDELFAAIDADQDYNLLEGWVEPTP